LLRRFSSGLIKKDFWHVKVGTWRKGRKTNEKDRTHGKEIPKALRSS